MLKKSALYLFISILLSLSFTTVSQAQDNVGETVRITTSDGNVLMGVIEQENDDQVIIRVDGIGEVTVQKSNIKKFEIINPDRIRNGDYWFDNPHGTRYFFAPNAIGLQKGTGYYQNAWIFFNNVNYGISNNFSIGAGLIPGFLFGGGLDATPLWILPKFSIPVSGDNFHLGVGAMIGGIIGSGSGALFYGSGTVGSTDKNLTVGLGYGASGGELSSTPLVNISGMYRAKRTIYMLGELYVLPGIDGSGVALMGARWAPENFAVDFGLILPLEDTGDFIAIPWLGVSIPFGNR
tara:strand:- start:24906 stop:25784 length:879 start_codon:yes stop_codon:yes gene_type:complete